MQLAVLIASAFSMYNRLVDGFRARTAPSTEAYRARAAEIADNGYSAAVPLQPAAGLETGRCSATPTCISRSSASASPAGSHAKRIGLAVQQALQPVRRVGLRLDGDRVQVRGSRHRDEARADRGRDGGDYSELRPGQLDRRHGRIGPGAVQAIGREASERRSNGPVTGRGSAIGVTFEA